MWNYIAKRFLLIIPTFIGISVITFLIIHMAPGDPSKIKEMGTFSSGEKVAREVIEETRRLYGLDMPLHRQYIRWLGRIVRLDFGESLVDHRPVMQKIKEALPITLALNFASIFLIYLISIPTGVVSAVRRGGVIDRFTMLLLLILYSLPSFWVASMLITYLAGGEHLNLFPVVGYRSLDPVPGGWWGQLLDIVWHLVLPVVCLTYGGLAFLSRFTRGVLLEVLGEEYLITARAKGIPERQVIWRHAFRNALIPMTTLLGTLLPALLGGSVIIEQIFSIPGMGRLGFQSILSRDYPTIMAIATIQALVTLFGLLLVDLVYIAVDPRIRLGGRRDV
jgi:peptide/nickel transport system permease protein